jgi:tetratricopeptide (TPR) repeat protein
MKTKSVIISGLLCLILAVSCSINKMAINAVSGALSGTGSSDVFTGDPDPDLVGDALPFAIKMYEALLSQNPKHQGLLLTTGSLFVMYANAFIQGPAEMLDPIDFYQERRESLDRAKKLYLRGTKILYGALDNKYPGFSAATVQEETLAPLLKKCKKDDVPLLYWTAAGSFAAYSIDVFDFSLGYNIPEWGAMMARAYELDPNFNEGAIDEFYILYYASLPENMGGDKDKAEIHFQRALEKSDGLSAGAYVSYAKAICADTQNPNYDAFVENLEKALAIDPDENKSNRLVNTISQRKARFMLDTAYDYFSSLP